MRRSSGRGAHLIGAANGRARAAVIHEAGESTGSAIATRVWTCARARSSAITRGSAAQAAAGHDDRAARGADGAARSAHRVDAAQILTGAAVALTTFATGQTVDAAGWYRAQTIGGARQAIFAAGAPTEATGAASLTVGAAGTARAVSATQARVTRVVGAAGVAVSAARRARVVDAEGARRALAERAAIGSGWAASGVDRPAVRVARTAPTTARAAKSANAVTLAVADAIGTAHRAFVPARHAGAHAAALTAALT